MDLKENDCSTSCSINRLNKFSFVCLGKIKQWLHQVIRSRYAVLVSVMAILPIGNRRPLFNEHCANCVPSSDSCRLGKREEGDGESVCNCGLTNVK